MMADHYQGDAAQMPAALIDAPTWPGFPFSHRKVSYSVANSGALSFMSNTLMATMEREI